MKALLAAAIVGTLLSLGACASAPASDEPELVVDGVEWECRRITDTGKMIPKKICGSPEQWAQHDADEAEMAARASRRIGESGGGAPSSPGMSN